MWKRRDLEVFDELAKSRLVEEGALSRMTNHISLSLLLLVLVPMS